MDIRSKVASQFGWTEKQHQEELKAARETMVTIAQAVFDHMESLKLTPEQQVRFLALGFEAIYKKGADAMATAVEGLLGDVEKSLENDGGNHVGKPDKTVYN